MWTASDYQKKLNKYFTHTSACECIRASATVEEREKRMVKWVEGNLRRSESSSALKALDPRSPHSTTHTHTLPVGRGRKYLTHFDKQGKLA